MAIETPQTKAEAQALCELWAELDGDVAAQEGARDAAISEINATADQVIEPLVARRDAVAAAIEPFFMANRDELLTGKLKSTELGGCVLGTRTGRATLGVAGDKDEIAVKLSKLPWAKDAYVKTKVTLDAPAISKGLLGKADRAKLKRHGLSIVPGKEAFFINRTEQGRTSGKAG